MRSRHIVQLGLVAGLAACSDPASTSGIPTIHDVSVSVNPNNNLSTIVAVHVTEADSVRVAYHSAVDSGVTPWVDATGDTTRVAVLGLLPSVTYGHSVEAAGAAGTAQTAAPDQATGPLPAVLANLRIDITGGTPTAGYLLTNPFLPGDSIAAVVMFDTQGRIRWYHMVPGNQPAREVRQQESGTFTIFVGKTRGWDANFGAYLEIAPDGRTLNTWRAVPPLYTDNHELIITSGPDGRPRLHLFGYDSRYIDLTPRGGLPGSIVIGHQLLRQDADGRLEMMFSAWETYTLADWIEPTPVYSGIDYDHPNSLDIDADGQYIASWRNLGEVSKIDYRSGALVWRLGGVASGFSFVNDPLNGFSGQHSARGLGNNRYLIYDNGLRHAPQESRAVEYQLDLNARTATMAWQYRHSPALFTFNLGSVQRYHNGNTLVGFGEAGHMDEITPAQAPVWHGTLRDGAATRQFYRVIRVPSVYSYIRP